MSVTENDELIEAVVYIEHGQCMYVLYLICNIECINYTQILCLKCLCCIQT